MPSPSCRQDRELQVEVKAIKNDCAGADRRICQGAGQYESLADLESRIREHMASRKRRSVEGETKDHLFAALTERYAFAVPESLVQAQIDTRLERGLRPWLLKGCRPSRCASWTLAACARPSATAPWPK